MVTKVFVSILNWNDAVSTMKCLDSARQSYVPVDVQVKFIVLDNGSNDADWTLLQAGLTGSEAVLIRQEMNTGFAAGHNVVIRQAIEREADYVWLLNNDAIVQSDTLVGLLSVIAAAPKCGIVSPLIYAHHDENIVDFVGAVHDWERLDSKIAADPDIAKKMQTDQAKDFFVFGTAPLIRVAALGTVGLLDENLFAYYEDDDICTRLSKIGWLNKMAFSVAIKHFRRSSVFQERPPYFFYLMARNSLFFFLSHTPSENRRWIRLRLVSRSLVKAAYLRERGFPEKSDACLLGILDGLRGRGGAPRLSVRPPSWLVWLSNIFPYRLQQWLA